MQNMKFVIITVRTWNPTGMCCIYRALWIQEEKELLQEVAGMGELREPWHMRQVELLDRHLHLLHLYSQAKENLEAYRGISGCAADSN